MGGIMEFVLDVKRGLPPPPPPPSVDLLNVPPFFTVVVGSFPPDNLLTLEPQLNPLPPPLVL